MVDTTEKWDDDKDQSKRGSHVVTLIAASPQGVFHVMAVFIGTSKFLKAGQWRVTRH